MTTPPRDPPEPGPGTGADDAESLLRLVGECQAAGIARNALLLRLSLLPRAMTRPHHLRLARAALDPLLRADRARLFRLSGEAAADLVVVWRGDAEQAVALCLMTIGRLFADPCVPGSPALAETLLLPRDADTLLAAIDAARLQQAPIPDAHSQALALDTVSLATLEARLSRADMSRFARRRDICALDERDRFVLQWEKRFLSVEEVTETLAPDRAVRADPWLYRRLTRTLDQRMLALLAARGELREAGPFAINLNVASILAPEFLRFDANLPAALRGRVVLALHPADMLADPSAFLFARDFARARLYRLLLRGISAELMDVLPLESSGLDLLQLRWSPALARVNCLSSDPSRTVLAGADSDEAIAWGRARGIAMFCGRLALRGARAPLGLRTCRRSVASRGLALGDVAIPA